MSRLWEKRNENIGYISIISMVIVHIIGLESVIRTMTKINNLVIKIFK